MKTLFPDLPSGRIAEGDLHREAAWMPGSQAVLNTVFAALGPAVVVGNIVLGVATLPLVLLALAVTELRVRRLPVQRARWDGEGLDLSGPFTARWRWEQIDELGFSRRDPHRIRFVVEGQEHWLRAPSDPAARDALLTHWGAQLNAEDPALPVKHPQWFDAVDRKEAQVRFGEGPAAREPGASAIGPALWVGVALSLAMVALVGLEPASAGAGFALGTMGALAVAFLVPSGMAMAAFFSTQRRGTVEVDQHGLTLDPVDGEKRRFSWDAITGLERDELELRLTTAEGSYTYDFSQLRVDRTRGLLGELEERWRGRTAGEADEDGREAMRRLQEAAERAR